jgi:hypothetical protein
MPTDLYHLPPVRERLASDGVADESDADNDISRFRDDADDNTDTDDDDDNEVGAMPPAPPPAKWAPRSPRGDGRYLEITPLPDCGARVRLTFEHATLPRTAVGPAHREVDDQALAAVRGLREVRLFQEAVANLDALRRAAEVARAGLAVANARRAQLLVQGTGADLPQRLRDLDRERAQLQTKVGEADELARNAAVVVEARQKAARAVVEAEYRLTVARASRAYTEREAALVEAITAQIGDQLTELARVQSAGRSVGGLLHVRDEPSVNGLLMKLRAEAAAAPRAESPATATT